MKVAPTAGTVAVIQCSLMIWLGYVVGRAFGWTGYESLFTGALIAISSTTIVVKAFAEQGVGGKLAELVFAILIVEDLIAILLLAILTAFASGVGLSPAALAATVGKLAGFLVGLLVVGMLVIPRFVRALNKIGRNEPITVACVGICFGFALLARAFGYSVALGAFLGGALVAESGHGKKIEHLVEPVRDVFAAVFFVSVGMLIDPVLVAQNWLAVVVLTLVVVFGKLIGVALGAFIAGSGVRTSIQAGMSLAQIGEFSFIIAGVGLTLGVTRHFLYPVAVAVSALTTLLTPWLIRSADAVAASVDRRLPHALQTYASLYGSWVHQLGSARAQGTTRSTTRGLLWLLTVDVAAMGAIIIGGSVEQARIVAWLSRITQIDVALLRVLAIVGTGVLLLPFLLGAMRIARALGHALASEALPVAKGLDLAQAPRRALVVTLQIGILLAAGIPLVAVTQPFLPSVPVFALLLVALVVLIVPLWRSATNLHGHVRAGAQVILEALSAQGTAEPAVAESLEAASLPPVLPGLGNATTLRLDSGCAAVGQTLKQTKLRGLTGATVIAIDRGPDDVIYPTGDEVLREGDLIVLTGTEEAVRSAVRTLAGAAEHRG